MSLAIPGRFWVILAESPVKRRDRRCVFYEMIDFPIRKRHFLVWWSVGGPWEPPGRKKRRNQMFLQDLHSFAPLQSQILQIFRKFFRENFRIFSDFCKIFLNFCENSAKINNILTQICKISEIRTVQKDANLVDFEKCCKMRLCSLS